MSDSANHENQSEVLRDLREEGPWLTKGQAALRLDVSERTIENYIAERRLGTRPQSRAGKRPLTLVDPEDVERLAAEQQRGAILPPAQALSTHALAPHVPEVVAALITSLRAVSAPPMAQIAKPFVAIAEAAEYSGLPAGLLRRLVKRGALAAARFRGVTYVRRADLDAIDLNAVAANAESDRATFAGGSE